jgi:hypothetical protein
MKSKFLQMCNTAGDICRTTVDFVRQKNKSIDGLTCGASEQRGTAATGAPATSTEKKTGAGAPKEVEAHPGEDEKPCDKLVHARLADPNPGGDDIDRWTRACVRSSDLDCGWARASTHRAYPKTRRLVCAQ